jgi:hypothetical protein
MTNMGDCLRPATPQRILDIATGSDEVLTITDEDPMAYGETKVKAAARRYGYCLWAMADDRGRLAYMADGKLRQKTFKRFRIVRTDGHPCYEGHRR